MEFTDKVKCLKGVSFDPNRRTKKFKSIIRINGKLKHLGYFRTEEEAHQAYVDAKTKHEASLSQIGNK
jgi:hypothetical protein